MTFSADPRIALWERERARIEANEPPPNADNPPKRHHYVPELYLRRFAARPRHKKGTPRLVCVEARLGPKSGKLIGVRHAAVEVDFYTVETEDPRRAHEAEHIISVIEKAAGYAFAAFDKNGATHFPDDVDRRHLSMFMALQFIRGPETAEFQEQFLTDVSRMVLEVAAANPNYMRRVLAEHGEDTSDEAVAKARADFRSGAKSVSVAPHKNQVVVSMLRGVEEYVPYFLKRRWIVGRSRAPLLTSDRPVLLLKKPDPDASRGVGLLTADSIVYVLDRHRVLLMLHPKPGDREGVVDVEPRFSRLLNTMAANHARRWVFHHPDDKPLDGIPFNPNPPPLGRRR